MYCGVINYYLSHQHYINVKDTRAVMHTRRLVKYISILRSLYKLYIITGVSI